MWSHLLSTSVYDESRDFAPFYPKKCRIAERYAGARIACAALETKNGVKEIPLPRQAEIICIWTESPDQAHTEETSRGERGA
jgi:hypothetical protein